MTVVAEAKRTARSVSDGGFLGSPSEKVQRYENGLSSLGVRAEKTVGGVNTAFKEDVGV